MLCKNRSAVALTLALLAGAINVAFVQGAAAQSAPGLDVAELSRSDYEAKGLPLGGFRAFPTLAVGGTYDDNIYRSETGTVSDWYFTIAPSLLVKSEWSRHMLSFNGGLEVLRYMDQSTEDVVNWNAGGAGQLDILRTMYIAADADYAQRHEPRSSPNDSFGIEPTPYKNLDASVSLHFKPNRFGIVLTGDFNRKNYDPVARTTPPGGFAPNDDRDRDSYIGTVRLSYDFSPGYAMFVQGSYETRQFDQMFDRTGVRRDTTGYNIDGGLQFMLTNVLEGEIYAGHMQRHYKAPLTDVSGVDYGGNLTWYASPLTTVRLRGSRSVSDTTLAGASGSDDRSISLSIDHELARNILLTGDVGYTNSDYPGIIRQDDLITAGAGVEYLLNRYFSLKAKYSYEDRSSNVAGASYTDNMISLGLKAKL